MPEELTTRPTIETVLERIIAFENRFETRIDQFEKDVAARFDKAEGRFDSIDNEIDRVASVAHSTKAEMLALRADFRELRTQLREVLPAPQAT
jgi:hypothetical protein